MDSCIGEVVQSMLDALNGKYHAKHAHNVVLQVHPIHRYDLPKIHCELLLQLLKNSRRANHDPTSNSLVALCHANASWPDNP